MSKTYEILKTPRLIENITPHFTWHEARDRTGRNVIQPYVCPVDIEVNFSSAEVLQNIITTAYMLEKLRMELGRPLSISSWYRNPRHPIERKKEDGPGAHSMGVAVDIRAVNGQAAHEIVFAAAKFGFHGFGISQRHGKPRFVHCDWAPDRPSVAPRPTIISY